jgi:hypothetical protein
VKVELKRFYLGLIVAILGIGLNSLYIQPVFACSCGGNRSFATAAKFSTLVVRGKVLTYWAEGKPAKAKSNQLPPRTMLFEVTEIFKGTIKSRKLFVQGDNGMQCRHYVTQFPVGTEWILALAPDRDTKKGELAIRSCGEFGLAVKGDQVVGRLTVDDYQAKPVTMTLANFRKLLKSSL